MSQDVFERVDEIANNLSPDRWMLVGGLMVHAQGQLAGIQHARPTDDVDLVVEVRAGSYAQAAAVLQKLGYVRSWVTFSTSPWIAAPPSTDSPGDANTST